jgi:hypothetical protein
VELYVGTERHLELTCLSTIPGSLGPEQSEYADRQMSSVKGNVPRALRNALGQISEEWQSCANCVLHRQHRPCPLARCSKTVAAACENHAQTQLLCRQPVLSLGVTAFGTFCDLLWWIYII